jgi:hypothetical protein
VLNIIQLISAGLIHPQLKTGSARQRYPFSPVQRVLLGRNPNGRYGTLKSTKFVVKVNRGGSRAVEYALRIDSNPVQTTVKRGLALAMGKLTAQEVLKSLSTSRCTPELVPIEVNQ